MSKTQQLKQKIQSITSNLSHSSKNIFILISGTVIGQLIPIAITPIITRLYEPEMFGILALFISIASIVAPFATGSYEVAIMLPKKLKPARYITWLCIYLSLFCSIISSIIIIGFNRFIIHKFNQPHLYPFLYIVPLAIFIAGSYQGLHYYNVRKKHYKLLSKIQIYKSSISSALQIGIGYFHPGPLGLILGYLSLLSTGSFNLFKKFIEETKEKKVLQHHRKKLVFLAKKYKKFPLISTISVFFSNSSEHIRTIFIASLFSPFMLGQYAFANRLMNLPLVFIGNSINQVYFQEATLEKNNSGKALKTFYSHAKKLLLLSIPTFLLAYCLIIPIIKIAFGEKWVLAGIYGQAMSPFFLIRLIVSPNTVLVNVFEKQTQFLIWQISFMCTTISTLWVTKYYHLSILTFIHMYSATSVLMYTLLFFWLWKLAHGEPQN